MSSPTEDEGSVLEAGADAEGGHWARVLGLLVLETPGNSEDDEGGSPGPEGSEGPEAELEVAGVGGPVLRGREGRPGTPADVDGRGLHYLGDEAATTILQQLTDRGDLRVRRYPSPESGGSEGPADWVGQQLGARGSGAWAGGPARSQTASATLPRLRAPEGDRAWGSAKRGAGGAKGSSQVAGAGQRPSAGGLGCSPSDSESSDEFPVVPVMKVSIRRKGGGLLTPLSPQGADRQLSSTVREELPSVPGSLPPSVPRRPAPGADRPAVRELEVFSRKPSVARAKTASRPSYLPAAAAAGGLPKASPRRKVAQEKRFSGGSARLASASTFFSGAQRGSTAPTEPGTFPPISGVPLLRKDRRNPYLPVGTKQSKHTGAGQKSLARKKRGSEPAVGEDKDPKRDTGPKGPPQTHRPGPSCPFGRPRECKSSDIGDVNIRASQLPGHSQPLALSQGEVLPRGPAPDSDQEPLEETPRPESWQHPPVAEGCPRCPELQREVEDLRHQVAVLQSLLDEFQKRGCE